MTLIEQNAMIAKFMGYEYFPFDDTKKSTNPDVIVDQMNGWHKPTNGHYKMEGWYLARTSKDLAYHRNWSWLMPVCEKIRTLGNIIVDIELGGRVIISFDDGVAFYTKKYCYATKNIEAVYAAVIDFIKFYNNNKID